VLSASVRTTTTTNNQMEALMPSTMRKMINGIDWTDPNDPDLTESEREVLLAMISLAQDGWIVDSGMKRFSKLSGQMEIVWVADQAKSAEYDRLRQWMGEDAA
jgi:hypothetical protein